MLWATDFELRKEAEGDQRDLFQDVSGVNERTEDPVYDVEQ